MRKSWFSIHIFIWMVVCAQTRAFAISRIRGADATRKDAISGEPSCDVLRAMWRFSKRQSRAAEVTNEIPTYRDPLTYNVWEPYVGTIRSAGGLHRRQTYPIYGRLVKSPMRQTEMQKAMEEVVRTFGTLPHASEPRRGLTRFRLGGGHRVRTAPQSGSFQRLKELVKTERARELQEQRMAEEIAARAAVSGFSGHGNYRNQASPDDTDYSYETERHEDMQQNDYPGHDGIVTFPDILAPAARFPREEYFPKEIPYYRSRRSSYYDMSSLSNELEDLLL